MTAGAAAGAGAGAGAGADGKHSARMRGFVGTALAASALPAAVDGFSADAAVVAVVCNHWVVVEIAREIASAVPVEQYPRALICLGVPQ